MNKEEKRNREPPICFEAFVPEETDQFAFAMRRYSFATCVLCQCSFIFRGTFLIQDFIKNASKL